MILDKLFIHLRKPGHYRFIGSRVLSWYGRTFIKGPRTEDVPEQVGPEVQQRVASTYFDLPVERYPNEELDHWNIGQLWATQLRISEEPHVARAAFIFSAVLATAITASASLVHSAADGVGQWVEERKEVAAQKKAAEYQEKRLSMIEDWEKEAQGYSAQRCIDEVSKLRARQEASASDRYAALQRGCSGRAKEINEIAVAMPKAKCLSFARSHIRELSDVNNTSTWVDNIIAPECGRRFEEEIQKIIREESA